MTQVLVPVVIKTRDKLVFSCNGVLGSSVKNITTKAIKIGQLHICSCSSNSKYLRRYLRFFLNGRNRNSQIAIDNINDRNQQIKEGEGQVSEGMNP